MYSCTNTYMAMAMALPMRRHASQSHTDYLARPQAEAQAAAELSVPHKNNKSWLQVGKH
jgi:hypothetical protein